MLLEWKTAGWFSRHRVLGSCKEHFWVPRAILWDAGSHPTSWTTLAVQLSSSRHILMLLKYNTFRQCLYFGVVLCIWVMGETVPLTVLALCIPKIGFCILGMNYLGGCWKEQLLAVFLISASIFYIDSDFPPLNLLAWSYSILAHKIKEKLCFKLDCSFVSLGAVIFSFVSCFSFWAAITFVSIAQEAMALVLWGEQHTDFLQQCLCYLPVDLCICSEAY